MKSEIMRTTNFIPVKLEIIFESHFELNDFIARLKADNHLPNPTDGLIRQVEAFAEALYIKEGKPPAPGGTKKWMIPAPLTPEEKKLCIGNMKCPVCASPLWGIPNDPMPLHCRKVECTEYLQPAK